MSAVAEEKFTSRKLDGKSGERIYVIKGATDDSDAKSALLTAAPTTIGSKVRQDIDCSVDEIGGGMYIGTAVWAAPEDGKKQPGDSFSVSFDISGQTTRITQSITTVNKYARPSKTAKDFKGAIQVGSDGVVEGTEIIVPALTYSNGGSFLDSQITAGYVAALVDIVGSVNAGSWQGFSAGVLLLTGVSGQRRADTNWDLTFRYAALPNKTGLTVGSITGIAKKGWEYLWVYYEEVEDASSHVVNKIPVSAYVEQVYPTHSYSGLIPS